jgi:DNA-binding HxlR family transcriptional regulator
LPQLQQTPPRSDLRPQRDLIAALGKEYALEILQELHELGWSTASELARDLGIHVATAMRKLAELDSLGLLERRTRDATDTVEYFLKKPRLEIVLDFAAVTKASAKGALGRAERLMVREKPNRKVILESDEIAHRVRRVLFLKFLRRRTEARVLELSDLEGRFLGQLPYASETARSVAEVCQRAGIESPLHLSRILEFVGEMERLGIVEVVR